MNSLSKVFVVVALSSFTSFEKIGKIRRSTISVFHFLHSGGGVLQK